MMIMKFNKMIRNKVVWWIIGSIVIITFVGWFSPHGGCENESKVGMAGSLDGKPVTDNELRQARFNTYLGLCLSLGRVVNITPAIDKELRDQAWKRIAALRAARDLNISATPEEVLAMLKRDPQFQADGAFSRERYHVFCQNVLGTLNASVNQFEQQLSENIILQKLHGLTAAAVWLSPDELKRMAARYADSFRLDYVTVGTNSIAPSSIKLTDADLLAYYTQHTNAFVVPPKVSVRYVQIPVKDYLAKAVDKVDTNTIEEYYATHSDEFSTTDTNGIKTATPLDQVSTVISNRLLHDAALQLARDAANELVDKLVPDRDGKADTFEDVAAKAKLKVLKTGLFDSQEEVAGIDAGLTFNTAAFRLRPSSDEYFSDAVAGKDHVYLMALATNTEAYLPAFDAIRDEVKAPALAKASQEALEKKAQDLQQFFKAGLAKQRGFAELAHEKAMTVSTTALFSVSSAPDALSSPEILGDVTLRNAHELTDVLPGANGLIVAYIVERKAAGNEELATIQNQVAMSVIRRRARLLFNEWENSLVAGGKKTDNHPIVEASESPADDEQ